MMRPERVKESGHQKSSRSNREENSLFVDVSPGCVNGVTETSFQREGGTTKKQDKSHSSKESHE